MDEGADLNDAGILACDIYAVGIMLWQLWFQQAPFAGFSLQKLILQVALGLRPPVNGGAGSEPLEPAPPPQLVELMQQCWAADPKARPTVDDALETFFVSVAPAVRKMEQVTGSFGRAAQPAEAAQAAQAREGSTLETCAPDEDQSEEQKAALASFVTFLESAGLGQFIAVLLDVGCFDIETLCDPEVSVKPCRFLVFY